MAGRTVVDAVKMLLDGLKSNTEESDAPAVSLSGPAAVGVTTKVTVAPPDAGSVPRLQVMSLVPAQLP